MSGIEIANLKHAGLMGAANWNGRAIESRLRLLAAALLPALGILFAAGAFLAAMAG
jgi:hypothetical protein